MNFSGEVLVLDDEEVDAQVVEMLGPSASLIFPCQSTLRYLVMHVKSMDKFFSFEIEYLDIEKMHRGKI